MSGRENCAHSVVVQRIAVVWQHAAGAPAPLTDRTTMTVSGSIELPTQRAGQADRPGSASRLASLDAARFIAAIGVIWIHAAAFVQLRVADDSGFIGRFAVPFFTFSAAFYAASAGIHQSQRRFASYVLDRFRRLYLPFACWTVLYLAFKLLQSWLFHARDPQGLGWWLLWDGGSYHLWFLPFICGITIAAFLMGKLHAARPASGAVILALCWIGGTAAALAPNPFKYSPTLILRFGFEAIPAALWAIGLANLQALRPRVQFRGGLWFGGGVALMFSSLLSLCRPGPHVLMGNLAGVGLALAGFSGVQANAITRLQRLGALAYGIYLFHIMPMGVLRSIGPRLHLPPSSLSFALVAAALVLIVSIVVTHLLSQWKLTSWLVPGNGTTRPPTRREPTTPVLPPIPAEPQRPLAA